ncbi:MAG: hypothetical protein EOP54_13425 [Sphingobacteriales bacterium]|nr:MAG: hypothetical protein EOP54_13425 [Sphingobacteriales bacterium]
MKNKKIILGIALGIAATALLSNCASIPKKARAVQNFDANKYLGTWYEIARFDYRFEKNMDNVSAQYSLKDKGNIKVFNSGHDYKKNTWKSSTGVAKFRINKRVGALKVSFFKPFYAGYNVVAIDEDYQYALVAGRNLKYLWLLSRKKTIPESVKQNYIKLAEEIGYDTSKLIWVKHDKENPLLNAR